MARTGSPPAEATPSPDPQDPLAVPMDHVITQDSGVADSHTRETADPADVLPDDPEEQNDLA